MARPPVSTPPPRGRSPRIVAIGGGTGLPIVLAGLKEVLYGPGAEPAASSDRERLTAVVTMADDGGSSGRLRRAYHVPSPGDVRNCLLALSERGSELAPIFGFRFNGHDDQGLTGHSLGNLILTALCQVESDFSMAVRRAGRILGIGGRVLPATLDDVTLAAELAGGGTIEGESRIATARRPIRRITLRPPGARALPEARRAFAAADLIVLGPGSLFTSLIPVLLVRDLADAVGRSGARVVLAVNLMAEPGETEGYRASDMVRAILRHAPQVRIDTVLIHGAPIPRDRLAPYERRGVAPIPGDLEALNALGCRVIARDLLAAGPLIRHDPARIARALLDLIEAPRRARPETIAGSPGPPERGRRQDAEQHPR
jgi:uncharacterized cofD-like protein